MSALATRDICIPPMSPAAIERVTALQEVLLQCPQSDLVTHHVIHAGLYARTIRMPAGTVMVGALIKIPTLVIVNGHATVTVGDETVELCGYQVIPASAGRKQAWAAHADTDITLLFPSDARTVEQAEVQFTDDADLLMSRTQGGQDTTLITGE